MLSGRDFGTAPLPLAMATLHREEATGTLEVSAYGNERALLFVDGELRAARSSAEDEKLGSWLVGRGLISEEFKQLTLLGQGGSDAPPLGHILVSRGVLGEDTLESELEELALTIIRRASTDRRDSCVFDERRRERQLDTLPNTTTPQLILIAARALHGELDLQRAALGSPAQLVARTDEMDVLVNEFELTMPESILLGKLHTERPLFELRAVSGLDREDFYAAAYGLLTSGMLVLKAAEAGPVSHPPPAVNDSPSAPPEVAAVDYRAELAAVVNLAAEVDRLNHYEVLGLPKDATYQQIFDAWSDYQERFHPKRSREPHLKSVRSQLENIFSHGQEAFEVLSSPERRPHYDRMIRTTEETRPRDAAAFLPNSLSPEERRERTIAANLTRVDSLVRGGDVFSAVKLLEQTADMEPKPSILLKLARLMLRNPLWTNRAMEKLRRAVEIDPAFVDGWLEVASFWNRKGSRERQRKALERALAHAPDHPEAVALYRELVGPEDCASFLERVKAHARITSRQRDA